MSVPGGTSLSLDLPVRAITADNPATEKLFDAARAATPRGAPWSASAHVNGSAVDVVLHDSNLANGQIIDAFAIDRKIVTNAPPKVTYHPNDIDLTFKKSEYFETAPTQFNVLCAHRRRRERAHVARDGSVRRARTTFQIGRLP